MEPLVYQEPLARILFGVTLAAWLLSELRIAFGHRGGTGERLDRGSRVWVVACVLAGTGSAFGIAWQSTGYLGGYWTLVGGFLLAAAGMGFRAWSVATLGVFFTTAVEVQEDHRIIDSGPYRWLRHPSYTGALLTVAGVTLELGNWAGCLVAMVCALAGLVPRILIEEHALASRLGPSWDLYARDHRRLIPLLW